MGVAAPISLPIIYFSKIATQKQREKDGIRHEASTRQRTGFILKLVDEGPVSFKKDLESFPAFFLVRTACPRLILAIYSCSL